MRFETTYTALAPQLQVVAPWREWDLRSREALLDYLKGRDIPTTATLEKIYSRDANAWHISTEGRAGESVESGQPRLLGVDLCPRGGTGSA